MKDYIAIDHTNADHHKHTEFDTMELAQSHIDTGNLPNGFAALNPGGNQEFWIVDHVAETVILDTTSESFASLQLAIVARKSEVDVLHATKGAAPITSGGHIYDAHSDAVDNIHKAISYGQMNAIADATTRTWTLADNSVVTITWGDLRAMSSALFERGDTLHGVARTHKNAIDALGDVAAVNAYNITANW